MAIEGSRLMPRGRFLDGTALDELDRSRPLVLLCKVEVRAAEALAIVRAAGWRDAIHLEGGILAWIDEVDPSLVRY